MCEPLGSITKREKEGQREGQRDGQRKEGSQTKAGGIGQVVKHLPSKHKALSSNPIPPKQKTNGTAKH
jgi:hypothetical protein